MITSHSFRSSVFTAWFIAVLLVCGASAQAAVVARPGEPTGLLLSATTDNDQAAGETPSSPTGQSPTQDITPEAPSPQAQPGAQTQTEQNGPSTAESNRERAAEQVKRQEQQRILGIAPNFNTSYISAEQAVPLSVRQKFSLAFRSAVDPFQFIAAGLDAAYSQATNDFPEYGQGAEGYAKRFGASYADNFDGTILGNAVFPALLRQDPRYFRKGTGTFTSRLLYSISTTVWCKNDNGKWGPNYSNVLGNLAAGGISNLYYPESDRGAGLTFERGFTVTAEGTIGAVFDEFWPDIAHKVLKNHLAKYQPNVPPPSSTPQPGPPAPK